MDSINVAGKIAVVVGGTSGLGKAIALGLVRCAADVVATSRSQDGVSAMALELQALGRSSLEMISDVTSRPSLQASAR